MQYLEENLGALKFQLAPEDVAAVRVIGRGIDGYAEAVRRLTALIP